MQVKVTQRPSDLPIAFGTVKDYLRVEHDAEDSLLDTMLRSAISLCEGAGRCYLGDHTFELIVRNLPKFRKKTLRLESWQKWLPHHPNTITSVTFSETTESVEDWVPDSFRLDAPTGNAMVWNLPRNVHEYDTVRIVYTGGIPTAQLAPEMENADIRLAVLEAVGTFYENRAVDSQVALPAKSLQIMRRYWDSSTYHD